MTWGRKLRKNWCRHLWTAPYNNGLNHQQPRDASYPYPGPARQHLLRKADPLTWDPQPTWPLNMSVVENFPMVRYFILTRYYNLIFLFSNPLFVLFQPILKDHLFSPWKLCPFNYVRFLMKLQELMWKNPSQNEGKKLHTDS